MKKAVLLFLFTFFFFAVSFSQLETFSDDENLEIKAIKKENHIIDVYYGVPIKGINIRTIEQNPNLNSNKTSILGPTGLRYQYMLLEDFGIGVDISYEQKSIMANLTYSDPLTGYSENFDAEYSVTRIKAMARFSWEFFNTEQITMSWANSIGYRNLKINKEGLEDRIYLPSEVTSRWISPDFPIAIRSAIGARIFLIEKFAVHGEFGFFGGGWLLAGVSAKF